MATQLVNPLASTQEWKEKVELYKTNLLKYQPGPKWYFGGVEEGLKYDSGLTLMTMEDLDQMIKHVSPIGPKVDINSIKELSLSHEQLCEMFPHYYGNECISYLYNYEEYMNWIDNQSDVFYYARSREDFNMNEAYRIASDLGYSKLIVEDLS